MKQTRIALAALLLSTSLFGQDSLRFSLAEARAYAVEHSYFTRSAMMDEEIARKRVKETTAIGLPQVSASGEYQNFFEVPLSPIPAQFSDPSAPEGTFDFVPFATENSVNGSITVSQLLFDGSYIVGLQAARTYRELSQNARIKSEQEIKDQVTRAYASVLIANENVSTLEGNLKYLKKTLDDTRALNEEGFAEDQDVDQLQILLSSADNQYKNAIRYQEIADNLLKFQLGIPVSKTVTLSNSLDELIGYGKDQTVLTQQFDYNSNIDFKLALTNQELMRLDWKNKKANFLPKLSAFYTNQRNFLSNDLDLSNNDAWIPSSLWGLNLSVPIFSSGMRLFSTQQARLEWDKAKLETQQVSEELTIEYATSRSEYEFALGRYENTQNNLDLIDKIVEKEITKYNEGISTSLDLANTQLQFFDIQASYIQSTLQLIEAKSALDKILNNYR